MTKLEQLAGGPKISGGISPDPRNPTMDVFTELSGRLDRMAQKVGAAADNEAAREGEAKGLAEVRAGEAKMRRDGTIAGRAYDRAVLRTTATRADREIRERAAAVYEANQNDPQAYAQAMQAAKTQFLTPLQAQFPELAEDLESRWGVQQLGYDRNVNRIQAKAVLDQQRAELTESLDARLKSMGRTAYLAGTDPASDQALATDANNFQAMLIQYGPKTAFEFDGVTYEADEDRAGVLSLEDIQSRVLNAQEDVAFERLRGVYDRIEGLSAREAFLSEFQADYQNGEGAAGLIDRKAADRFTNYIEGGIREEKAAIRQAEAEARARRAEIRAEISDVRSSMRDYQGFSRDGFAIPQGDLKALYDRARATGDADLQADIVQLGRENSLVTLAMKSSPTQVQQEINSRRAGLKDGGTPDEVNEIRALEGALSKMNTELARDPVSFAVKAGIIEDRPPALPMVSEETGLVVNADVVAEDLVFRRNRSKLIEQTYGVAGAMFTDEQAGAIGRIEQEGGAALLTYSNMMVQALGDDAPDALSEISGRAPTLAHFSGLTMVGGDPKAIEDGARGLEALRAAEKETVSLGRDGRTVMSRTFGQALSTMPRTQAQIEGAAKAIYVGRVGVSAEFDSNAWEDALQDAAGRVTRNGKSFGGVVEVRGREVLGVSWLRSNRHDDVFRTLTMNEVYKGGQGAPVAEDGSEIDLSTLRRATPVPAGHGRYYLALGDPDGEDPQYVVAEGEDGLRNIMVFDLNAIQSDLAQRRPDWVQ